MTTANTTSNVPTGNASDPEIGVRSVSDRRRGGEPMMVGLPTFSIACFALGLVVIGFVPAAVAGAVVPITFFVAALFQFVAFIWAAALGRSVEASINGLFSGFWFSFSVLLLGLAHNWFAVPAANTGQAEELFFVVWAAVMFFLWFSTIRMPLIYPVLVGWIVVGLILAAIAYATGNHTVLLAAGADTLLFAFLGFWAFVNLGQKSIGRVPMPPIALRRTAHHRGK